MLPQPIPARSNACLEPKSARRHVLTPITEKSRPSVSVERSVSTSCTKFRAAPGACARPAANGWLGAATGMSSTPPTLIRSMPGSVASTPLMPISAMPEWTSWVTAPSASTYSRSVTVGNRVADRRCSAPEPTTRRRKTARLDHRKENGQLIETGHPRSLHFKFLERYPQCFMTSAERGECVSSGLTEGA